MALTPEQMRVALREAEVLSGHIAVTHTRLAQQRITETRGPATVTLDGLGAIVDLSIAGVDQEVADCLLAALRAAEGRANEGYDAFGAV